jgi:hypothetical protein
MRSSRSAALRGGAVRRTLATRTSHSLSQGLGFRQQRPALSGTCLRHVKQPDKHELHYRPTREATLFLVPLFLELAACGSRTGLSDSQERGADGAVQPTADAGLEAGACAPRATSAQTCASWQVAGAERLISPALSDNPALVSYSLSNIGSGALAGDIVKSCGS